MIGKGTRVRSCEFKLSFFCKHLNYVLTYFFVLRDKLLLKWLIEFTKKKVEI